MTTKNVQARIDEKIRNDAVAVLDRWGLTISDVVRILLTRTAREGSPPIELMSVTDEHDLWFRKQVQQALDDDDYADGSVAKAQFERQRSKLKAKLKRHAEA